MHIVGSRGFPMQDDLNAVRARIHHHCLELGVARTGVSPVKYDPYAERANARRANLLYRNSHLRSTHLSAPLVTSCTSAPRTYHGVNLGACIVRHVTARHRLNPPSPIPSSTRSRRPRGVGVGQARCRRRMVSSFVTVSRFAPYQHQVKTLAYVSISRDASAVIIVLGEMRQSSSHPSTASPASRVPYRRPPVPSIG